MEQKLYVICPKSEQGNVENLLKEPLAKKGFTLIACTVDSDPDTWEEPANAELVALWLTPNSDNAVYTISSRRLNSGKQTVNIFPEPIFMPADKKRSVGRNQSVFASLHPSGIANVLRSVLPKPKPQETAAAQPETAPVQPLISENTEPEAPEKEEKKFPSKIVWIIFAVVAALIVFFIIGKDDEEIAVAEEALAPAVENCLSESQLINLIQLANKKQSVALTPSFAKTIEQYEEAPNVVREGGIYKPDPSPELLVEQPEQGNVLSVEILNQTYSEDGTQGEIVFEYFTQTNGYESPHRKAVALIYNEDENWRIYDFGMDATNYGNEPTYYLSGQMSDYITASNRRIQSGETFRDLNLMFSDSPEELEQMKTAVCEYAEKYDVTIPDSLTCYFYIETPTEAAK